MSYNDLTNSLDVVTQNHIQKTLSSIPHSYHNDILKNYSKKYDELPNRGEALRSANLYFLDLQEAVAPAFNLTDEAIERKADRLARNLSRIIKEFGVTAGIDTVIKMGVDAPTAKTEMGVIKRLSCEIWWKRQLFKQQVREHEAFALRLGIVNKYNQIYCSNAAHERIQARQEKSIEIMAKKEAVCDGEIINMLELLEGSLANPKNRFAEIYTRAKGFESYGDELGHICELVTITCPSRMHPSSDKYDGTTPRQAQKYLTALWNRASTSFKDNEIYPYGFRVAEAHADGCPHWHIWLFTPEDQQDQLNSILEDHSLREDGTEKGAEKYRIDFEPIDLSKGSASSYLFKYISKNLDGFGVGTDFEADNQDSSDTAPRVRSWASTWGIRQIQQVGGPSVGVWRELRRLKVKQQRIIEHARMAAHDGDWKTYFEIQGGHEKPKQQQPIKTLNTNNVDMKSGEIELNYYGEPIDRVKGVRCEDQEIITRTKSWEVRDIVTGEEKTQDFVSRSNLWDVDLDIQLSQSRTRYLDPEILPVYPFFQAKGDSLSRPWIIHNNSRSHLIDVRK